jgi:hypothetical protein
MVDALLPSSSDALDGARLRSKVVPVKIGGIHNALNPSDAAFVVVTTPAAVVELGPVELGPVELVPVELGVVEFGVLALLLDPHAASASAPAEARKSRRFIGASIIIASS